MTRLVPALLAAALLAPAAADAQPAGKPSAKAAPAAPFDAQNPQSLIALLATLGAEATIAEKVEDAVFLKVASPAYSFNTQFAGCDAQGRRCKAVAFEAGADQRTATIVQLNAFNQTSLTCRAWQAKDGKPHVMYSALVSSRDDRAEMETHLAAWRGCLADFGAFLKDPPAYLAVAP